MMPWIEATTQWDWGPYDNEYQRYFIMFHMYTCVHLPLHPFLTLTLLHTHRGDTMCRCSDPAPSTHQEEGAYCSQLVICSSWTLASTAVRNHRPFVEVPASLPLTTSFVSNIVVPVPSNVTFKSLMCSTLTHPTNSRISKEGGINVSVYWTLEQSCLSDNMEKESMTTWLFHSSCLQRQYHTDSTSRVACHLGMDPCHIQPHQQQLSILK